MDKRLIFRLISLIGLGLSGIATLLSSWAEDQEQNVIIEEKINEALAARKNEEK